MHYLGKKFRLALRRYGARHYQWRKTSQEKKVPAKATAIS
jgi:hypothetical protein